MKAIPSLFVGLAVLLPGCRSYNLQPPPSAVPRPDPGLASLESTTSPAAESVLGARTDPVEAPVVELGQSSSAPPRPLTEPAETVRSDQAPSGWRIAYESDQRRPIHVLQLGAGDPRVFVTAGLHGDDAASVQVIDALATRLAAGTPASSCLLLRTPNPDGLASGRRWNANGVDLNRNFPSPRFVPDPDDLSGAGQASETETRVLLRVLNEYRPQRVIQIRTTEADTLRAYADAAAELALRDVLEELRVERGRFEEVSVAGSLEEFASVRLRAETVTVIVPASAARQREMVDAVLALCGVSAATHLDPTPVGSSPPPIARIEPDRGPAALTGILEPIGEDGAYGYVELLPPPPDSATEQPDRSGFFELPPPL